MKKLICILSFLLIPSIVSAAFPDGWNIIGHVDLPAPSATLTDFPVVIAGMPSTMLTKLQADFEDFRPTLEDDGTSPCHYEIPDRTSQTTANAEIWIKVGSYSTSGNGYNGTYTRIFIWGNNSEATQPAVDDVTWGSEGVWDSSTLLNYHMKDATTSSVTDSTTNDYDGTKLGANTPAEVTGKLGKAQNFAGTTQYITPGSLSSTAKTYTWTMWVKSSATSTYLYIFDCQTGRFIIHWNSSTFGKLGVCYGSTVKVFGDAPDDGSWHFLAFTFDSANSEVACFVDGVQNGTTQAYTGTDIGGTAKIGKVYSTTTGYNYQGYLDEFSISTVERSSDWLASSYACQNAPTTFGTWTSDVYAVTFSAGVQGSLSGTTTQYLFSGEDCSAVTATGDTGYSFSSWSGSYGTTNPLTITNVTSNISVTASFTVTPVTALSSSGYTYLGYADLPAPDANLTNFPICLSGLPTNIFAGLQVDFKDLRFTSDSSGTLPLAMDIPQRSTPTECNSEIWVRIPSYLTAGDGENSTYTRIHIWGHNPTATYPDADDTVWGSQRVWYDGNTLFASHMHDLTTSTVLDSTSGGLTCSKTSAGNPAVATGKIGDCQTFSSDYVGVGSLASTSGSYTISMWAKSASYASTYDILFDSRTGRLEAAWFGGTSGKLESYDGTWRVYGDAPTDEAWHYFVFNFNAGTSLSSLYQDNVQIGTDQTYASKNIGGACGIGAAYTGSDNYFAGSIDEFSISTTTRSAAWNKASYLDQADTASYADYTAASYTPQTWYVGNSGGTYGVEDGTSQANAWPGWVSVVWANIYSGDTIMDFSNEAFQIEDKEFNPSAPLIIDGSQSLINGAVTIDNADWTNVSGNIYRVAVAGNDCDYMQTTAPASPSVGEKWFVNKNIYGGTSIGPAGGRALEWTGSEWAICNFFYDVHMAWVDGLKTYPVITDGTVANYSAFNGTTLTNTDYGGHADNYWVGSVITIQTAGYRWEASRITASTGNVVTFGNTSYSSLIGTSEGESYIIGNYNQLASEGQWAYDAINGYFYVYSADPDAHTWQYSGGGCGIFISDCSGITVQKYTIRNTNDSAILLYQSPDCSVKNNSINTVWSSTHLIQAGAIAVWGDSPYFAFLDREEIDGVEVSHNSIANTLNGQGIWLATCNGEFNYNAISSTGDSNYFNGTACGIFGENASGNFNYNYIYYSLSSGIFLVYSTNSEISYNVINHSMNLYTDGGCLYLVDNVDGNAGGNVVEYNRIEYWGSQDVVAGIYIDNKASYNTVQNNTFYNGPGGNLPHSLGLIYVQNAVGAYNCYYNTVIDNVAYTDSGTFVTYSIPNTVSNNTFEAPADYPYIGGGVGGARMLLNFMQ